MKQTIAIVFIFLGYSQIASAQRLTDWQMENLRGRVKVLTSIDQPQDGNEAKKEVLSFDERGFLTYKWVYLGTQEEGEARPTNYTKLGELQYFEYQDNQRHVMSLNADGTKATDIVQQWPKANTCEFTYTYFNKPENKGSMRLSFSNQNRVSAIHLLISNTDTDEVQLETKSLHQYDAQGYEIKLEQKTLLPYGDTLILTFRNTIFDAQGNIVEKSVYDENQQLLSKTFFTYEYYE
ncbi:hypothetical protein ACPDHL_01535 [Myroides sp. C15-4]|uniref:hypothetical protein n=1 Tax=Myroides sp. C15-4 TaxID=3400532 RepID=UPI003D2F8523